MCCTLNAGGERKGRVAVSAGVSCTVTRAAPVPETEQAGEQTRHSRKSTVHFNLNINFGLKMKNNICSTSNGARSFKLHFQLYTANSLRGFIHI